MNRYEIKCTEEQTKKALELGAPIKIECFSTATEDHWHEVIPTAEQVINWLEDKKIFVHIVPCFDISCHYHISSKGYNKYGYTSDINVCQTRKEATLKAIDAALEYLTNNNLIK